MRWILMSFIACILMLTSPDLKAQDTTWVYLQDLVSKVLTENPQLQSARFNQQSVEAEIPAAGALPDPTLGFNLMSLPVNSFSFDQAPMTGKQITLMQHFPFPGKLNIKQDIAGKEALIRSEKVRELRNQLVKQVKTVYYNIFYTDRALTTIKKSKMLLKQLVSVAQTKYSVGKGLQQDVLRAQLEFSSLIDREITLRQKRSSLVSHLNTLINEPPGQPVGMIPKPAMQPVIYTLSELKEMAARHNPMLAAWQTTIDQSDSRVALAEKQIYPDFSVGLAYTQRDALQNGMKGYDFLSAMFKVSLPVYYKRKQNQQVQQMKLTHRSVQEHYQNVRNSVYRRIRDVCTELQKNRKLVDLYKSRAVPQSRQSFESAMSAYQNNKVDFLTLLNSELSLLHMQLAYYRALSDYNINIAELTAITGSPVLRQL